MSDEDDSPPQFYDTQSEVCDECGVKRPHHVRIEVIEESEDYGGNQPYRIRECQICGVETRERIGMGD